MMEHEFLTNRVPEAASYLLAYIARKAAYIAALEDVLRENRKSVQMRNSTHCLMHGPQASKAEQGLLLLCV